MAVQVLFAGLGPEAEQQHSRHEGCGEKAMHDWNLVSNHLRCSGLGESPGIGGFCLDFVTIISRCCHLLVPNPLEMQQLPLF